MTKSSLIAELGDIEWINSTRTARVKVTSQAPLTTLAPKVFTYARFSTNGQQMTSIERQLELCNEYADRAGFKVNEAFYDAAVSGTQVSRSGIDKVLNLCDQHPGSILIVEDVDRIVRSFEAFWKILGPLSLSKTKIHDVRGLQDTERLLFSGYRAVVDREKLVHRTQRRRVQLMREGVHLTLPAYGYEKITKHKLKILPQEEIIILDVFNAYADGATTVDIRNDLNNRGIKTKKNKKWTTAQISRMLRNQTYVGFTEYEISVNNYNMVY